jgi:hypothetical protein
MFATSTTRLKVAGAGLCAAVIVTTGWAAWIPLAGRMQTPVTQAVVAREAKSKKNDPAHTAESVERVALRSPKETPAEVVKPAVSSPPAKVKVLAQEMPVDLPQLFASARGPAIDRAATGLAWAVRVAVKRNDSRPVHSNPDEIVLYNPATSGGPVHFLAAGAAETLRPGEERSWPAEELGVLRFHRGGEFGNARLELPPGVYEFHVGERGWDVVEVTRPATASAQ